MKVILDPSRLSRRRENISNICKLLSTEKGSGKFLSGDSEFCLNILLKVHFWSQFDVTFTSLSINNFIVQ